MAALTREEILNEFDQIFDENYNSLINGEDGADTTEVHDRFKSDAKKLLEQQCDRLALVVQENSKLLSSLQSFRGNILVYVRVRPIIKTSNEDKGEQSLEVYDNGSLSLHNLKTASFKPFAFDQCFGPTVGQEAVFDQLSHLTASVMQGFNVSIIAYGQTGSGKTYTMFGTKEHPGLIFRLTAKLFEFISTSSFETNVRLSMVEIYNEEVYDLLGKGEDKRKVHINMSGDDIKLDCDEIEIPDNKSVREWFYKGMEIRTTAATNANDESSRSHCILTLYIDQYDKVTKQTTQSKLYMVDLAGSERIAKTGVEGDRLTEAKNINKSLSALSNIMQALDKKNPHVPYRDSKLTMILKDSLNGNAKTILFCTLCPTEAQYDESYSTLQFATRAKNINLGVAKQNVQFRNADQENKDLRDKIDSIMKDREGLVKKINELEEQLKQSEDLINGQKAMRLKSVDNVKKEADDLKLRNNELQVNLLKFKEEQAKRNKEIQSTERSMKILQTKCDNLQKDKDDLLAKVGYLNEQLRQAKENLKEAKKNASANNRNSLNSSMRLSPMPNTPSLTPKKKAGSNNLSPRDTAGTNKKRLPPSKKKGGNSTPRKSVENSPKSSAANKKVVNLKKASSIGRTISNNSINKKKTGSGSATKMELHNRGFSVDSNPLNNNNNNNVNGLEDVGVIDNDEENEDNEEEVNNNNEENEGGEANTENNSNNEEEENNDDNDNDEMMDEEEEPDDVLNFEDIDVENLELL